jgi:hypothetical protein
VLQSVIFGEGGLDITNDGIIQLPAKLPDKCKLLNISAVWVGELNHSKD